MNDFYQLPPRRQTGRLKKMALTALQSYDLTVQRVRLLADGFNTVFQLDGRTGEKYVLRVSLPGDHTPADTLAEMTWLAALKMDPDFAVPEPVCTKSGDLMVVVEQPGVPEARQCVVFRWIPGELLADEITPENWRNLGELMARLHEHAATFTMPAQYPVRLLDKIFCYREPNILFEEVNRDLMPLERQAIFWHAIDRIDDAHKRLFLDPAGRRVLHGDLHQWNVKLHEGQLIPIDFEDLMLGYPVQDAAISLYYVRNEPNFADLRAAFQEGYESRLPWMEQYPGQLATFMMGRGINLFNLILWEQKYAHQDREELADWAARLEGELKQLLDS